MSTPLDFHNKIYDTDGMKNYVKYTHGATGIVLHIMATKDSSGDVQLQDIRVDDGGSPCGDDILPIMGEDTVMDIELFLEDYLNCLS